jgi:prepilin-type N-terminal cleavage/methylation domain-containing protein
MWTGGSKLNGFTLLEIIIALGLISLALIAALQLQAQNLDFQSEARFITTATYLAQDRVSKIQSLDNIEPGTSSGDFGDDFPYFRYSQEIEEVLKSDETNSNERLFKAKVTISLEETPGTKDFSVEIYLHRGLS